MHYRKFIEKPEFFQVVDKPKQDIVIVGKKSVKTGIYGHNEDERHTFQLEIYNNQGKKIYDDKCHSTVSHDDTDDMNTGLTPIIEELINRNKGKVTLNLLEDKLTEKDKNGFVKTFVYGDGRNYRAQIKPEQLYDKKQAVVEEFKETNMSYDSGVIMLETYKGNAELQIPVFKKLLDLFPEKKRELNQEIIRINYPSFLEK